MRVSPGPVQSSHGAQGAAAGDRGLGLLPGVHGSHPVQGGGELMVKTVRCLRAV